MINKNAHKIILTVTLLMSIVFTSRAQYSSEEDLKVAANEMFEQANYVDGVKLFAQLLSNYPKDPSYNYKYGTCVLFGSRDKEKSLNYLKFSITSPNVDPVAYYFLAKAYHHNYEFAAAIVHYNKFKEKATSKELKKYKVDREIEMCENGQKLIKSIVDIGVLSKKEIKESDFFRSYNLNGIGGKVIVKPDDFKTKFDINNNEHSVIYLGEKKDMVVYSSYGKSGATGKDIYRVIKLPSGEWSKPVLISGFVNSEFDEDYPFLHPDGRTLYFSSKGFNSMGGYDIFKSTKDASGQWSFPVNLDFPINTPDDDILYISDLDNKLAYFASSRASKQGEITVYRVKVDPEPTGNSVIKGFFVSESNPDVKSVTITIKGIDNDRKYGVYTSNNESGEYLLVFPKNGGKFKLLVETTDDAPVHSATIELPKLEGFRALKQELRLVGVGDEEKLVVKNLFDESDVFDMSDPLIVQNLLKQKAKLDVNTSLEEFNNSLASNSENESEIKSKYTDLTDDQIVNKTDETASRIIEQAAKSKEKANNSYQIASTKSIKAKEIFNESKALSDNGNSKEAELKKIEAVNLINEVVAAIALAKTLDNEVVERESDIEKVKSLQEAVNNDIDNGDRTEAETNLSALDKITSATYHSESALNTEEDILTNDLSAKQIIYNNDRNDVVELKNRAYELTETINKLEDLKKVTKKKSEKSDLEERIEALKIDVEDTEFDLDRTKSKLIKSNESYLIAKNKVASTQSVIASLNEVSNIGKTVEPATKLKLEKDVVYFEKEGLVGLYTEENVTNEIVSSSEIYKIEDHKDEFKIIDESGKIIDYNTRYSSELADAGNDMTEDERSVIIMNINERWIKDIDEEITIRDIQIVSETDLGKKVNLEEKSTVLKALKLEKQKEFIALEELVAANNLTINDTSTLIEESLSVTKSTNEVLDKYSKEEVNIMNADGGLIDYESKYTSELKTIEDKDDFESYSKKSRVHENWATATEQDILIKKIELAEANSEEKNGIENKIAILESNLLEQQEFSALYSMQAESITPTEITTLDPLASNETETSEEVIPDNEEINTSVSIVDYESKYTSELEKIEDKDDFESYIKKSKVHENWASATEQEILIKKMELAEADVADKDGIENEIAVLESNLLEQQEFSALYAMQAESFSPTESSTLDPLATNETETSEEVITNNEETVKNYEESIASSEEVKSNEEDNNSIEELESNTEESIANNEEAISSSEVYKGTDYKDNYKTKLDAVNKEDNYETTMQKVAIHNNWEKTIESKIKERKSILTTVDNDQKNDIANEIAVLESDLIEQQEFSGLYKMQAETMLPEESISSEEPIARIEETTQIDLSSTTSEEPTVEETNINETSNNTEEVVSNRTLIGNKLLKEDLTENNLDSPEDDFSNLKYNNKFNYTSTQSKIELINVNELKEKARSLNEKAETKLIVANEISSEDDKEDAFNEVNNLIEQSQRKQEKVAKIYENANRNEYYNNQAVTSELRSTISESNSDEVLRAEMFTEESDNYYDQAKIKREEAKNASTFVLKERALQKAYELEMKAIEKQVMAIYALSGLTLTEASVTVVNSSEADNSINAIVLEETELSEELLEVNEESSQLNEESSLANNVIEDVELLIASNSLISSEDQEVLLKLQPVEITSIKNSEEYIEFSELKAKKRRLEKEAEVEYVEAQKFEEEAKDQGQLGISLRAMAEGASSEEDKAKKTAQIEKLEKMITDNETKSAELKMSAANKEDQAKEAADKSDFILINAGENEANNYTVIEKIETYDQDFMDKVMTRTASNIVEEETIALAEEAENMNEELVEANVELNTDESINEEELSSSEDPISSEQKIEEETVSIEEPVVDELIISSEEDALNEEGIVNPLEESNNKDITAEELVLNEVEISNIDDTIIKELLEEEPVTNIEESVISSSIPEDIDAIPSVLSESIFVINNNKAAYSNSRRIPVSSKLPEGLVFKVQIGAFRNPIPQDHFRGFAPILAEDAGRGITRYTAGLFKSFNVANEAKKMIRDIGYNDAFVVGFFNGKRISMTEARAILDKKPVVKESIASNSNPEFNSTETNVETENNYNNTKPSLEESEPITTEEVKDGVSTDVRNIDGAFYAIQVGVYSKEVTEGQFNNVSPLNSERTASGLIRYTSGVHKTLAEANVAKDRIRGLGIIDAFVVAYKDGNKVTVATVTSILETTIIPEEIRLDKETPLIETSEEESSVKSDLLENDIELQITPKKEPSEVSKELGLEFKVQLGEYSEDVPIDEVGLFLKLNSRGVENYEVEDKTVYTIGSFSDYQSALDLQIEMKDMGVKNPKTIAFQKGVKIGVDKALELIKKNQ